MERVELIEDLDVRGFRAQGTVDAGGCTRTFTVPSQRAGSPQTTATGYSPVILSFCR